MTMPDPFGNPASGFDKITDYVGEAMIVTARQHVTGLVTEYTPKGETSDAVDADLVILFKDGTVKEIPMARIFQGGLIGQFRRTMGQMIIGRLGKVDGKKKDTFLWVFQPATEEDRALGMAYWTKKAAGQFANPAPAQNPAPAAAPQPAMAGTDPFA